MGQLTHVMGELRKVLGDVKESWRRFGLGGISMCFSTPKKKKRKKRNKNTRGKKKTGYLSGSDSRAPPDSIRRKEKKSFSGTPQKK